MLVSSLSPTDLTWVLTPFGKMGKEFDSDGNLGLDNPMGRNLGFISPIPPAYMHVEEVVSTKR